MDAEVKKGPIVHGIDIRKHVTSSWSEEDVVKLLNGYREGLSCSRIAARISSVQTRNAVIGKLHRMGLAGRGAPKRRRPTAAQRSQRKKINDAMYGGTRKKTERTKTAAAPVEIGGGWRNYPQMESEPQAPSDFVELVVPENERRGLQDLEASDCRWPIGDPLKPDFHFCNGKHIPGSPYCLHHSRAAYQPIVVRRQRPARHVFEPRIVETEIV